MSYLPDCRTDENYNEKYLDELEKSFVKGYDWAVAQIVNLIECNTNVYPDLDEILDFKKAIALVDKKSIVKKSISNWAEMQRNELVTSMIDGMDEDVYNAIKEKVDGERRSERVD